MSVRIGIGYRNTVIFTVIGKKPQQETGGKETHTGGGNLFFGNKSFLVCLHHMEIRIAAVQITPVPDGQGCAFGGCSGYLVIDMEIPDGPAVTDYMPLESPFSAQGILQQRFAAAGRFSVDTVVGAHDGFHIRFLYGGFKGGQIGFSHILRIGFRIEFMA